MFTPDKSGKSQWLATAVSCLVIALMVMCSGSVMAAGFDLFSKNTRLWTNNPSSSEGIVPQGVATGAVNDLSTAQKPFVPLATTSTTKQFWVDCGHSRNTGGDYCMGTLWFVDPANPVQTVFDDGVIVMNRHHGFGSHLIPMGTVHSDTDYSVSSLKVGYLFYIKNGMIYAVNPTTLAYKQISTENSISVPINWDGSPLANMLCSLSSFTNWSNPDASFIEYNLAGPDGVCWNNDDVHRGVLPGMDVTDPPMPLGNMWMKEILLDGRALMANYATSPPEIDLCQGSSCSKIYTFQNWFETVGDPSYDKSRVIMMVDGKLLRYDLVQQKMASVYTVGSNEQITNIKLDRDGSVYFFSLGIKPNTAGSYANSVKKISPAGLVSRLVAFTTLSSLASQNGNDETTLDIGTTHVVYSYPNNSYSALLARSVPKGGGAPILLSSSHVNGGAVGGYFFSENTSGQVQRMNLDGTNKITKADTQLVGATYGGSGDWYYHLSPATFVGVISPRDKTVRAFTIDADFSVPGAGTILGSLPYNLSNLSTMGAELTMLGVAGKRGTDFSYGSDVIFLDASTIPSPLKRLTNSNGTKLIPKSD